MDRSSLEHLYWRPIYVQHQHVLQNELDQHLNLGVIPVDWRVLGCQRFNDLGLTFESEVGLSHILKDFVAEMRFGKFGDAGRKYLAEIVLIFDSQPLSQLFVVAVSTHVFLHYCIIESYQLRSSYGPWLEVVGCFKTWYEDLFKFLTHPFFEVVEIASQRILVYIVKLLPFALVLQ